jgi:hypothetical protein
LQPSRAAQPIFSSLACLVLPTFRGARGYVRRLRSGCAGLL